MIKRYWLFLSVGIIFVIMLASCGNEAPPAWPWWTNADSTAVKQELTAWRDTFNNYHFLVGQNNAHLTYSMDVNVPIVGTDTLSRTGDSVVKIAHFLGSYATLGDSIHIDDLLFGRKNDSTQTKDTFCFVTYKDTSQNCIGILLFDSLWTIKFYPDTTVETTATPTDTTVDTTITYRVNSINKTGFSSTNEEQNTYHFTAMRKLELKKDSAATIYRMKYWTGFGMYVPNSTTAPAITNIIMTGAGRCDTFYYGARLDHKGIYNLKSMDSTYTVSVGESITVNVSTSTPTDTLSDWNYFFISDGSPYVSTKRNITSGRKIGTGGLKFTHSGLNHLYIEVIPASTLFYPYAPWTSTTWAIPIRVVP